MTDKQLAVRESDIHAAYGRARLNWEREGGDLVALITRELNALLAAAPAAPTEGARGASARQDEREALSAPEPIEGRRYWNDTPEAQAARQIGGIDPCQQVQADAGAGTEVAWLQRARNGMIRCARTKRPDSDDIAVAEFDGDTITPLYAHPDPLLAECVEALEMAELWLEETNNAAIAEIRRVLAKVQAAKEGKS
ncbi:hypothetical protein DFLDMN_001523 [Cupriavidus sp. H19C3]|uniref:hypothetical protein n=1 Tax=Cupriavidus sp. H19C3 TaxID=3241603 RepID=UPI003BF80C1F